MESLDGTRRKYAGKAAIILFGNRINRKGGGEKRKDES